MSDLKTDLTEMIVTTAHFGGMEQTKADKLAKILMPMIIERVFSHKRAKLESQTNNGEAKDE